jgi:hypothetical protein
MKKPFLYDDGVKWDGLRIIADGKNLEKIRECAYAEIEVISESDKMAAKWKKEDYESDKKLSRIHETAFPSKKELMLHDAQDLGLQYGRWIAKKEYLPKFNKVRDEQMQTLRQVLLSKKYAKNDYDIALAWLEETEKEKQKYKEQIEQMKEYTQCKKTNTNNSLISGMAGVAGATGVAGTAGAGVLGAVEGGILLGGFGLVVAGAAGGAVVYNQKLKNFNKGKLDGYIDIKNIYDNKINSLKQCLKKDIEMSNKIEKKAGRLTDKILTKIAKNEVEISDMKIIILKQKAFSQA